MTRAAALLTAVAFALLPSCTAGSGPGTREPSEQAKLPAPPAACLLDTATLATTTGLTWAPDTTTASDTRCVYDPGQDPAQDPAQAVAGLDFVTVDVTPLAGSDAAAALDTLAELCDAGSRAPVPAADGGFVCRFQGGSVFAAAVRGGQVVTVSASAVPAGTTAARLVVAFTEQLGDGGG